MKKILFTLLIISTATIFMFSSCSKKHSSNDKGSSEITWYTFNEGLELAKKENKPIIVDFYADWCKWCKVMEKETFTDKIVSKKMKEKFITIRIHTDKPQSQKINFQNHQLTPDQFSQFMGVTGLPTLLFLNAKGEAITKIPGYVKADMFSYILSYIDEKCYKKHVNFNDYKQGKVSCK